MTPPAFTIEQAETTARAFAALAVFLSKLGDVAGARFASRNAEDWQARAIALRSTEE